MNHVQELKKMIIGLAETFGITLTPNRLSVYVSVLSGLTTCEVEKAIKEILLDPGIAFFPLPAVILQKAKPTLSVPDAALELLGRCVKAVSQYGYTNPLEARNFVGEIAWDALGGSNGWVQFCCAGDFSSGGVEIGTARAQLREAIKSKLHQKFPGGRVEPLILPQAKQDNVLPLRHVIATIRKPMGQIPHD